VFKGKVIAMSTAHVNQGEKLDLGEIVKLSHKIGLEFVEAKAALDEKELLKPSYKAQVALKYDVDGHSETKIRRLTEADGDYITYLKDLSALKLDCEKLRVRYESYKNLFEARRSLMSYQKAEMQIL
jgi:hypothetical protein